MTSDITTFDPQTTGRVIESLVARGDISDLSPLDRAKYYLQMCEMLGLTAATQPFAILRLNGKEILYPTRGATDQLASIHRLNREIIDGPKVIDVAGTKMIYAVCRVTHPNGRVETSCATVPMSDPLNALMKAETKAKRRATLSILGLGMLDETEVNDIPAQYKERAPAPHDDPPYGGARESQPEAPPVVTREEWVDRINATTTTDELRKVREAIPRGVKVRQTVMLRKIALATSVSELDELVDVVGQTRDEDDKNALYNAMDARKAEIEEIQPALQVLFECKGPVHTLRHYMKHRNELGARARSDYRAELIKHLARRYPNDVATEERAEAMVEAMLATADEGES